MAAPEPAPAFVPEPSQATSPGWAARRLLRAARAATLATVAKGAPSASLITPACAPDLSVLMLLSGLSDHTRHLAEDPRCAVMVVGPPDGLNPQTAPRLTVFGTAARIEDEALKARWVARHPYAAFYAGFGDFSLWRVTQSGGHFIGGFASAHRIKPADLTTDPDAVARIAEAEAGIIGHCNDDHADALDAIARGTGAEGLGAEGLGAEGEGVEGKGWRMTMVDVDGFDLTREQAVIRVAFSAPVSDAGAVRTELVRLTQAARAARVR